MYIIFCQDFPLFGIPIKGQAPAMFCFHKCAVTQCCTRALKTPEPFFCLAAVRMNCEWRWPSISDVLRHTLAHKHANTKIALT